LLAVVPVTVNAISSQATPSADRSDRFTRAPGVRVEALAGDGGDEWVAFSALSGETHLINETSAAIVDLLDEEVPASIDSIVDRIVGETGLPHDEVRLLLADAWELLLHGGLIRAVTVTDHHGPAP